MDKNKFKVETRKLYNSLVESEYEDNEEEEDEDSGDELMLPDFNGYSSDSEDELYGF